MDIAVNFFDSGDFNSIGYGSIVDSDNPFPLALSGRVVVKVNLENGQIKIGDLITTSSVAGVGMRATQAGRVVAMALENLNSVQDGSYQKILVFVNAHYWAGTLNTAGQLAQTDSSSGQLDGLLEISANGSSVNISHISGFDALTLEALKEVVVDAPVALFNNIKAKGDIIAEGIKKTYYSAIDLWPGVDISVMASNWNSREVLIANDIDTTVRSLLSGSGAQAAEQSKVDIENNDSDGQTYLATYGVDSTRGEIQLTGTSTLSYGEAKVFFDYSFSSIISDVSPIRVFVTPAERINGQLYVSDKNPYGFVVKELNASDDGVKFDWLVIARRKGYESDTTAPSISPAPSLTPTPSPTPEVSESPTPSPETSETPTPTPEITETPTPSATPTPTETPAPTPSETPQPEETDLPQPTPEVSPEP